MLAFAAFGGPSRSAVGGVGVLVTDCWVVSRLSGEELEIPTSASSLCPPQTHGPRSTSLAARGLVGVNHAGTGWRDPHFPANSMFGYRKVPPPHLVGSAPRTSLITLTRRLGRHVLSLLVANLVVDFVQQRPQLRGHLLYSKAADLAHTAAANHVLDGDIR